MANGSLQNAIIVSRDPRWKVMFKSKLVYHSFKIQCSNADSGKDSECNEARKFGSSCWSLNSEFPKYTLDVSHWAVKRQAVSKADGNCAVHGTSVVEAYWTWYCLRGRWCRPNCPDHNIPFLNAEIIGTGNYKSGNFVKKKKTTQLLTSYKESFKKLYQRNERWANTLSCLSND